LVQLSLIEIGDTVVLEDHIAALARRHAPGLAGAATRVTASRFHAWRGRPLDTRERRRVTAYFEAVVRRRVITQRDEESTCARRALVLASIQADLVTAGWTRARAAEEALRVTGLPVEEGAA
jgi:hypothetical protein